MTTLIHFTLTQEFLMKTLFAMLLALATFCAATETLGAISLGGSRSSSRYKSNSLSNPYGAGSRYKTNGYMNPYSRYGSRYSNYSWRNSYATQAPRLYDSRGKYYGRWSANKYHPDSTSNPYGRFGSRYSRDSIRNPYGAGNPYRTTPIYVYPGD